MQNTNSVMNNINPLTHYVLLTLATTTSPASTKGYLGNHNFSTVMPVEISNVYDIEWNIYSESYQTMIASQEILARDWNDPIEDEAWANL